MKSKILPLIVLTAVVLIPLAPRTLGQPAGANPQLLVEPAEPVDPARLPDVEGIHLGMAPKDAIAILRGIYNPSANGASTVLYTKFPNSSIPAWPSFAKGVLPGPNGQTTDEITLTFSMPPLPQTLVGIQRTVTFGDHSPTGGKVASSLIQKYGPVAGKKALFATGGLGWVFDEQGNPVTGNSGMLVQTYMPQSGSPDIHSPAVLSTTWANLLPIDASEELRVQRESPYPVTVVASLDASHPDYLINYLSVNMSENGQGARSYLAAQRYLQAIVAEMKRRQIEQGEQQAGPRL
jgi:hypothetical protein